MNVKPLTISTSMTMHLYIEGKNGTSCTFTPFQHVHFFTSKSRVNAPWPTTNFTLSRITIDQALTFSNLNRRSIRLSSKNKALGCFTKSKIGFVTFDQ